MTIPAAATALTLALALALEPIPADAPLTSEKQTQTQDPMQTRLALVPRPVAARLVPDAPPFQLNPKTSLYAPNPESKDAARHLRDAVRAGTGFSLPYSDQPVPNSITFKPADPDLPAEGYRLQILPDQITITPADTAGAFYAVQTLRQLLPAKTFRSTPSPTPRTDDHILLPALDILDHPRFNWRGVMLDVARHFRPKSDILRFLDLLALHKINVFHFHLTDDQGWRVEIKRYPRLTEIGAFRKETVVGRNSPQYDGVPHGGYYTQDDLREIVDYAAERHITVVPEIDMPGHMVAAIAAYPHLGDGQRAEVMTKWGVSPRVLNTHPDTVQFCKDVLAEILDIFPSKFIHIGGDECPKDQWKADPAEQQRIKERGLKDEHELQSWFIAQMVAFLESQGRRLIGWDEITEGGLPKGAAVMSWRGTGGGVEAANLGHPAVMTPTSHMYLDYYQSRASEEPLAIGGYLPLDQVYSFDPHVPNAKPPVQPDNLKNILGVQGNIWTEYMKTFEHVQYMAFPRVCAIAEVGWTPQADRAYPEFLARLETHLQRLQALGVNYRPLRPADTPVATWTPAQVSTEWQELDWDLTPHVTTSGNYRVTFTYTAGAHRLDIAWAQFLVDGQPGPRDEHLGSAGFEPRDNTYRLDGLLLRPGQRLTLRAKVRADGGDDSHGDITLERL